jgi:DNA polymerase III gamma/tau subunit
MPQTNAQNTHTSLYRKYRPQTFTDVIGQDHIVRVLQSAIEKKTPHHAYLFTGTRGIGKTSIARIFARELGVEPEDITEIDAASYTGVDNICHTLLLSYQYSPLFISVRPQEQHPKE